MDLTHVLQFLGFPEKDIPHLLCEAASYAPALLEHSFSEEIMESVSPGSAKKMLEYGLSSDFVFHLAVLDPCALTLRFPLEIFHSALGNDWVDVLNENHARHAFGDARVFELLDRLDYRNEALSREITTLCETIRDELAEVEE